MLYFLQQIANAVPIAALYAALAFGYAIAFAVTRRADLTYGALFAFSGQMFVLFADFGWNRLWLLLPAALGLGAAAGLTLGVGAGLVAGRYVMRPLAFSSANTVVVASLGTLLVLMETARLASETKSLWLPPFLNGNIVFWPDPKFPVTLTVIQLLNTLLMVALVAAGHWFLTHSGAGRSWRAVSEDRGAAALCGIDAARVYIVAYGAASLIAACCGILAASYYGNMDFGTGLTFGVKVLFIAAIGGQTSPLYAALGAAAIGLLETLWGAYGPMLWRDFAIFGFLVIVLAVTRQEKVIP
ncbi:MULTISPECIES: branched-chain amino acid ABC transporter permease [unclassified Ensifer]|uniref:branched-chain amino acid ABC transporter permease n=1 Tax=unclassified Ensifer TaxID=2633371 RepID=UPI000812C708|nr:MULTISPECIES: branched-chain amino acid ABC transporter permease [unclassified Ensifer]OCP16509.1 branched-chain amino acid ABC transporter permease [Ensifer sp. LC54]OCP20299.1 branched-chain amino acid ABC transporter permease [Ensifer sp. LC384]OCP36635.1 branched-chain amino acid ABC transporter permease [Ensifer sp. LC163]